MNEELKTYIDTARKEGHGDASIREALLESGWDAVTVDNVLSGVAIDRPEEAARMDIRAGTPGVIKEDNLPQPESEEGRGRGGLGLAAILIGIIVLYIPLLPRQKDAVLPWVAQYIIILLLFFIQKKMRYHIGVAGAIVSSLLTAVTFVLTGVRVLTAYLGLVILQQMFGSRWPTGGAKAVSIVSLLLITVWFLAGLLGGYNARLSLI